MSDLDDDDFDVEGMMEGMEEEMAEAGEAGGSVARSHGGPQEATEEDEEEEEEERGVVAAGHNNNNTLAVPGQLTPLLGSPSGPATAGGSGSSAAGAAGAAKAKVKKRKSAAVKSPAAGSAGAEDDEERAAKMARAMSSGSVAQAAAAAAAESEAKSKAWQSRLSSQDRARFQLYESTHFSKDALRRVLASLLAPLPAGQGSGAAALKILPPLVVASMGAVAKAVLGEIIEEAINLQQQQQQQQQQQLTRQSSASSASSAPTHVPAVGGVSAASSAAPLQPGSIVEAYRRLVAAGRIPSRVTAPTALTGNGASSSLHNPVPGANAAAAAALSEQQSILQQQQQHIGSTPGLASTVPKAKRNRAWRR